MTTFLLNQARVEREAARLSRVMSLRRASTMIGVSPSQVARWRDGSPLTDEMARRVAVSIVARKLDMVGTFGHVDTRGKRLEARMDSCGRVLVRVTTNNDEGSGA